MGICSTFRIDIRRSRKSKDPDMSQSSLLHENRPNTCDSVPACKVRVSLTCDLALLRTIICLVQLLKPSPPPRLGTRATDRCGTANVGNPPITQGFRFAPSLLPKLVVTPHQRKDEAQLQP